MDNVNFHTNKCFSLLVGKVLKNSNEKYKKNYVAASICLPLLLIFGSYRFMFNNISYDRNDILLIEKEIDLNLPDNIKISVINLEKYNISYIKITDENEKKHFDNDIKVNDFWIQELSTTINNLLPLDIQIEIKNFEYFIFYNVTNNEYNLYPLYSGEYECVFIAYDSKIGRFIILNEYKINIK